MHRAQSSTVSLAALGNAANSQAWNIKYIWPGDHILQNGSDPAWGECCFRGEQDSLQRRFSLHSSKSVLVFPNTRKSGARSQFSQQEEREKEQQY